MKAFKLTDVNDQTYNKCQWGESITHTADGGGVLCSKKWIHFYQNKYLAVLFNPMHGNFDTNMHMWRGKATGKFKHDKGLKSGCTKLTSVNLNAFIFSLL